VRKRTGTSNIYALYDESGHWLGDYGNAGHPIQQAIWMDDAPVGLLANGGQVHYVQPDHLGTPRAVIDPVRDVAVWMWGMKGEAFGTTLPEQDADGDGVAFTLDIRFPGQRYDSSSGLNQNYFRDHEPGSGRYAQSDPLGLRAGTSTYLYVLASPLARRDPLGLASDKPGEYCEIGHGMLCGKVPSRDMSASCGEGCKNLCRLSYRNRLEDLSNNYLNDESCAALETDMYRKDYCEQTESIVYAGRVGKLRLQLSTCLRQCKPCKECL